MSGYSATKAAQVGFAESLRPEFAGTDIHVSVVLPVSTETEFRDAMARDYGHSVAGARAEAERRRRRPRGRRLHPPSARPEVYPLRDVARARHHQRRGARLRRSARPKYGRRRER